MLFPLTANWRAGMQEFSAAVDDTKGELVTVTPADVQKINFPSVADPSRSVTVVAAFMSKAKPRRSVRYRYPARYPVRLWGGNRSTNGRNIGHSRRRAISV